MSPIYHRPQSRSRDRRRPAALVVLRSGDSGDRAPRAVRRRPDLRRPPVPRAAATATIAVRGGQQAGRVLVRHQRRAAAGFERLPPSAGAAAHRLRPREEHRLPDPQLGLRPRRLPGRRAASGRESVPRPGADRARRVERPAVRRPARRSPRARAARRLDRARRPRRTCSSASTKKSTTSIGRCSSRSISKTTTSAPSIPGFRAFVDPTDLRGALQLVGGERFFCEQVNVRWPLRARPARRCSPSIRRF